VRLSTRSRRAVTEADSSVLLLPLRIFLSRSSPSANMVSLFDNPVQFGLVKSKVAANFPGTQSTLFYESL
jgi:hypothetical protein